MAYLLCASTHIYKYYFPLDIYKQVKVGAFSFVFVCMLKLCSQSKHTEHKACETRINTSKTMRHRMRQHLNN